MMTIIHKFYANADEAQGSTVMVQEKQINYTVAAINNLLHIQAPHPDDVMNMDSTTDLDEVRNWTVVRRTRIAFPTKELESEIKIWHHFICAKLVPTAHLIEVTREQALLLYSIRRTSPLTWASGSRAISNMQPRMSPSAFRTRPPSQS